MEADAQRVGYAEADSSGSHVTIDTVAHDAALDSGPEPVSCLAHSLQPQDDCSLPHVLCMAHAIRVFVLHHTAINCKPKE